MNLNHLAIFHAVASEKSISAGAERLCISQPAVSKQLRDLELALGAPLFDRLPRGVRLTEAGEILNPYARRLFALESQAESAIGELRGLEKGRLVIGASMTIGGYLLPDTMVHFHGLYPGIEIHLEIGNTEDIQRQILDGAVDIGLTEGFLEHPELQAAVLYVDEMVVIAPPTHSILGEADITAERVSHEAFIMREVGSGTRAVVERAFAARGLELRPAMALGNIEAIKRAVASGGGLAMVSSLAVTLEQEAGRIAVLAVRDLTVRRPFHHLSLRGRHQSHAAHAFTNALRERFPDFGDDLDKES